MPAHHHAQIGQTYLLHAWSTGHATVSKRRLGTGFVAGLATSESPYELDRGVMVQRNA